MTERAPTAVNDHLSAFEEAFDRVIPDDLREKVAPTVLDDPNVEGDESHLVGIYQPYPETEGFAQILCDARQTAERQHEGAPSGFRTGVAPFDTELGGLTPGSVTVVTGPPGSGKTSLAKQILDGVVAGDPQMLGFYVSPTERASDLRLRTLVRLASEKGDRSLSTADFRTGKGLPKDVDRRLSALLREAPWIVREYLIGADAGRLGAREITRLVTREIQDKGARSAVLVVDHLPALGAARPESCSLDEKILLEFVGLSMLANRIQGHVIVVYPYVRVAERKEDGGEKREGPSEILHRLGAIASDAPLVLSLATGQAAGEGCATVIKDRFGRVPRKVGLCFESAHALFTATRTETPRMDASPNLAGSRNVVTQETEKKGGLVRSKAVASKPKPPESAKTDEPSDPSGSSPPLPTLESERSPLRPKKSRMKDGPKPWLNP